MTDKTSVIFNNPMNKKTIKGANKSKKKYVKKFGDDSKADYKIAFKNIPTLDFINASNIIFGKEPLILPLSQFIVYKINNS